MLRSVCSATLALVASACLVPAAWGGIITPTGLVEGDQFRIVFVTSGTRNGSSSNIADYDAFVTNAAVTANLSYYNQTVTWQAIASTESTQAISRLAPESIPWYRTDDVRVTLDSGFSYSGLLNPINHDEWGNALTGELRVWTGTLADGSGAPNLQLGSGDEDWRPAIFGNSGQSNSTWIYAVGGASQLTSLHLYGVSNVLTAVPEPGCLTLWACGLAVFGTVAFVRRRRAAS
ncbi:MAG: hypothetical protein ACYC6N_07790 [Pirellulaceae bacterium]